MIYSLFRVSSKGRAVTLLLSLFVLLMTTSGVVQSEIRTYTNEAAYQADLPIFAPLQVPESFEDSAWDSVRSTVLDVNATPGITNLGLTWQNRFYPVGGVTTNDGGGSVHDGVWQFYASPHGGYGIPGLDCTVPGECSDGFTVTSTSAGTLYGVGGWFTGAGGAEIEFYLDGILVTGAGGSCTSTWQFYGVIDTNGFSVADIKEISGTQGDNNNIWADDFTIGATTPPAGSLQFSAPIYSVAEDGITATIRVTRTGGSFGAASVDYATSDGSATLADGDYSATTGTISFTDGDVVTKTFVVLVANNAGAYEGDETVKLTLSNATGATVGAPSTAVLMITENDPVPPAGSLQFSAPIYSVAENDTRVTITVTHVNGSVGTVGVDYASADGSATDGSDYTAASGSLSFVDGELTKAFTVLIFDDVDYEGDETVNLSLSFPTGGASLGTPSTAVLTITEDDPVPPAGSMQFSAPAYTVAEDGTTATITVTRVNGSFGTVGVDYASGDGTAASGSDYTAFNGTLSFADGEVRQSFSVDIFDDVDYEGDETVNLTLSNPIGGAGLDSPTTAVLTIAENDPVPPSGSLQFSAPTFTVVESGLTASITVARIGGSFGTVGVSYASADDSATAGSDYTAVSGSLSFADGVLSQTFSIDILDDVAYEGDEALNLTLSNPTGGGGLASPSIAVLTITEDDPVPPEGSLQFSAASYSMTEDGVTASMTVIRVGGSNGIVSVDYVSSDGTASAGTDYTALNSSLIFADGLTSQSFSIDILDDVDYEGDETVNLVLSNPTGGAGLALPSTAVLTIIEDDPAPASGSLQFSAPGYTVAEDGTTATITVTRVSGSFGTVGVDYASSDDTATAGTDYTAVSGSLSFADGVASQSFSIDILDDVVYEGDESLNLTLSDPTGGAGLGSPFNASLNINEDEIQTDEVSNVGSSGGSIDLISLILLLSLYLRSLRKNYQ